MVDAEVVCVRARRRERVDMEEECGEDGREEGAVAASGDLETGSAEAGEASTGGGEMEQAETWPGKGAIEQGFGSRQADLASAAERRSDSARLYLDHTLSTARADVDAGAQGDVASRPHALFGSPVTDSSGQRGRCCTCRAQSGRRKTAYEAAIALGVGVLHGVGGPGGVLGVLPSLLMPGLASSLAYLFSFCASATVTMGVVAICCGLLSSRSAQACRSPNLPWILAVAAATLSVAVGVLWIVGCATGRLPEMIHSIGMID
jgi:hypothetical protein